MFYVEKDAQLSLEMERNQNEIAVLREQVGSLQADLNTTKVCESHYQILSFLKLFGCNKFLCLVYFRKSWLMPRKDWRLRHA
jgi:hypothetical protein